VVFRDLHDIDAYRDVVSLERAIWGYTDDSDVVTVPVFIITVKRGAILVGAFDEQERMIGFVYSIVGMKDAKPMQWSHMMGVLPDYRRTGLGRALKLEQRDRAMTAGFDLIEWTFDPLQAANAHLNFAKLGVVSDEYAENIYGDSSSELHRGTPTDRLIVQWRIREPHVERRIEGSNVPRFHGSTVFRAEEAANAPLANPPAGTVDLDIDARRLWVAIPDGFTEMQQQAPDRALQWRMTTRQIFTTYFARGYRAVDFERAADGGGRYLLASAGWPA
jgi:predicted GNAT superfamily acetyltransferase